MTSGVEEATEGSYFNPSVCSSGRQHTMQNVERDYPVHRDAFYKPWNTEGIPGSNSCTAQ